MKEYKTNIDRLELKKIKSDIPKVKIGSSKDAQEYARKFYFDDLVIYESMFIILLNNSNNTIGWAKISQGGISGTVVDVSIIAKYAIESLAVGLIIIHNHPSGNLIPSEQDINITRKVSNTLTIFGSKLLDHIIFTEDNYYSFSDEGKI
jgi:DNA repair protein RadC